MPDMDHANTSAALSCREWQPHDYLQNRLPSSDEPGRLPASFSSRTTLIRFGQTGVLKIDVQIPGWLKPSILEIAAMADLDANWDSYGAPRINLRCAASAIDFLLNALEPNSALPSVVPTNRGSIQLEWHCHAMDLEIEFLTPFRLRVSFDDHRSGSSGEFVSSADLRRVLLYLHRLT